MEKTKPTASQIEVMTSDWLHNLREQDGRNYTHRGKNGISISRAPSGATLTDYLAGDISGLDELDLLKRGRATAEQLVSSIALRPMHVTFGGSGSYTDTVETVNLATDFFDESLSNHEKMDILLGLACHESAHVLHSDTEMRKDHIAATCPSGLEELTKAIGNILEDERIELLLGETNPGTASLLGAMKRHYFDRAVKSSKTMAEGPTERIPKMINTIISAVRYPSSLDRDFVAENYDDIRKIRDILTPYPMTEQGVLEAADSIVALMKEEMKEEMKQNNQSGDQKEQGNQDKDKNQNQDQNKGQGQDQDKDQNKGNDPEPTDAEAEQALAAALQTSEGQDMMKAMKAAAPAPNEGDPVPKSNCLGNPNQRRYVEEGDSEMTGGGPGDPKVFVFKPKGDAAAYAAILSAVRKYIPAMSRALACKSQATDYELRGLPSGKLNTNKLVSLRAGNANIFSKRGTVTCSGASVCMLIDESGSMSGTKQSKAREAAVLINETVKRIGNVDFYCYGYTDDRFNVYCENGRTSRFSLSATEARGGTPTGRAMEKAAERLRRSSADPCLMLVLTDGSPDNDEKVIAADKKLRARSIVPVGVGIACDAVRRTFRDYVVLNDMGALAQDLGRLTRGKLDRMLVRTESTSA